MARHNLDNKRVDLNRGAKLAELVLLLFVITGVITLAFRYVLFVYNCLTEGQWKHTWFAIA